MHQTISGLERSLAKIERHGKLPNEARNAFLALPFRRKLSSKNVDLVREGDLPTESIFLEHGVLDRAKTVPDGGRQIVSLHIPGDMVDLHALLIQVADHRVTSLTSCTTLHVPIPRLLQLCDDFPEIRRALWFDTLVDAAIYREWTLNIGQRDGRERITHLLLEMGYRFEQSGIAARDDFSLSISQGDLGDAVGQTQVHTSRVLTSLRKDGLLNWANGHVTIPHWQKACDFAEFDPLYLHPEGPREH